MQLQQRKGILMACALVLAGCAASQPVEPPDTRAADEAAIQKTNAEWVKAAQTKQVDPWVAFYSDDAVVLPPNDKLAATKDDIRKGISDLLKMQDVSVTWQQNKVIVARSGDIAYSYGTYELSMKDAKGKPITDKGKTVNAWKKQPDGSWKVSLDAWNTDQPLAPPPK